MEYFEETNDIKVKEKVLAAYGKTLETFKKDLEDIKVWLKTQPHLPQVLKDEQIERYLILCKCDVQKVKPKIDMYFTIRTRFPDVFADSHPFNERIKNTQKYVYLIPLPKLCQDLTRIFIIKVKPLEDLTGLDVYACFALLLDIVDIRFFEDVCCGHTIIFDLEHVAFGHLVKMTPVFIKTVYIITEKALTTRTVAVHVINAPSFIDQTVLIVKSLVKPKIAERIFVHRDGRSGLQSIDESILPMDYGGTQKSLEELEERLWKKIEEYKDFFDQKEMWRVDEELRPEKLQEDSLFGCYGNFKQLQVD